MHGHGRDGDRLSRSGDGLDRFVDAQSRDYPRALAELRQGHKQSHWIWYVFPQVAGLGRSAMSERYAITDLAEARAYLAHPVLGARLRECTGAMLDWAEKRSAAEVLGGLDALKFASSMTLFEAAGGDAAFSRALDAFFDGRRDTNTRTLLGLPER